MQSVVITIVVLQIYCPQLFRSSHHKCVTGDRLLQGVEVLPLLIQVMEKGYNQPSNTQLVSEALAAACLLIKLSLADIQAGRYIVISLS